MIMKKLLISLAIFASLSVFNKVDAQHINISINIGNQPAWGPVGYNYARYYYLPDIDCYYNIDLSLFYFRDRGHWVSARYLPYAYHNYNLYHLYKVIINDHNPWHYHHKHVKAYAKYKGNRNQAMIYRSNDNRYKNSRNNRVDWVAPKYRNDNNARENNSRNNGRSESYKNNNNRKPDRDTGSSQRYSRSDKNTDNKKTGRQTDSQRQNSNYNNNLRYTSNSGRDGKSAVSNERRQASDQKQLAENSRTSRR